MNMRRGTEREVEGLKGCCNTSASAPRRRAMPQSAVVFAEAPSLANPMGQQQFFYDGGDS